MGSPKSNAPVDYSELSKDDLITKIKKLEAHVVQLKNLLTKAQYDKKEKKKTDLKPFDFSRYNTRHVLLKFCYLGWDFDGYTVQEDTINTVEAAIFDALTLTRLVESRESANYNRCGRTDKGVSAYGQVISIDLRSNLLEGPGVIVREDGTAHDRKDTSTEISYMEVLNKVLPPEIRVLSWCPVEENFSARFDCVQRTYKYFFPKADLDLRLMKEALRSLLGQHDFRNFCKMDVSNGVVDYTRYITYADIKVLENKENDEYEMCELTIMGKAFLWHQIRCIVAVLFLIAQKKESVSIIEELLDIEQNPCRPQYSLASEIPLNLFECEYDGVEWIVDKDTLEEVLRHYQKIWAEHSVKTTMIHTIIDDVKIAMTKNPSTLCGMGKNLIISKTDETVSYGFYFHTKDGLHKIHRVENNSPADMSGLIKDSYIVEVNGENVQNLDFIAVSKRVVQYPLFVRLLITTDIPPPPIDDPELDNEQTQMELEQNSLNQEEEESDEPDSDGFMKVQLLKQNTDSYGFYFHISKVNDINQYIIHRVTDGSIAEQKGIKVGDVLIEVNDYQVQNLEIFVVIKLINQFPHYAKLKTFRYAKNNGETKYYREGNCYQIIFSNEIIASAVWNKDAFYLVDDQELQSCTDDLEFFLIEYVKSENGFDDVNIDQETIDRELIEQYRKGSKVKIHNSKKELLLSAVSDNTCFKVTKSLTKSILSPKETITKTSPLVDFLIPGEKTKTYTPLHKRQKCVSLDSKMQSSKRRKISPPENDENPETENDENGETENHENTFVKASSVEAVAFF